MAPEPRARRAAREATETLGFGFFFAG